MYHNNIVLTFTFLGLFLFKNVLGTLEATNLAKQPTSISKSDTENPTILRSNIPSDLFKLMGE